MAESNERQRSSTPERVFSNVPVTNMQTPVRNTLTSPPSSTGRRQVYSDRYIPSRSVTNLDDAFDILENKMNYQNSAQRVENVHESQAMMNNLLRSELLGHPPVDILNEGRLDATLKSPPRNKDSLTPSGSHLFKYRPSSVGSKTSLDSQLSFPSDLDSLSSVGSISSPARRSSITSTGSHSHKPARKIPKAAFKVLDAPSLQDDYYLNLLDWSPNNVLAVALGNSVYLWSACTSKVLKLCDYEQDVESVTSIAWSTHMPHYLSVGTSLGRIQVWDTVAGKMVRDLRKHDSRVGALAWNSHLLTSGSRDRNIYVQDIRMLSHSGSRNHGNASSSNSQSRHHSRSNSLGSGGSSGRHHPSSSAAILSTPPRASTGSAPTSSSSSLSMGPPTALPSSYLHEGERGSEGGVREERSHSIHSTQTDAMSVDDVLDPSHNTSTSTTGNSSLLGGSIPVPPSLIYSAASEIHRSSYYSNSTGTSHDTTLFSSTSARQQTMRSVFAPPPPLLGSHATAELFASPLRHNHGNNANSYFGGSGGSATGGAPGGLVRELRGHRQEVCGLKWSFDEKYLASGGNDNKLLVWDLLHTTQQQQLHTDVPSYATTEPLHRFEDHTAAVKAVAWSPHQAGLLASGGGTADRHIRFWSATTGLPLHKIDTGSQVCNLMWSRTVNEVVSTHGYSLNQIIVWKYPSMQKLATLSGHTMRVLYLAMSPDGQTVVTGAGDETLRFWNIFPLPRSRGGSGGGTGGSMGAGMHSHNTNAALMPSTSDAR